MAREAPHMRAAAAEARLHFVGNEQSAGRAHSVDRRAQKTGRIGEHAVARKDRVDQQACGANAVARHVVQRLANVARKDLAGVVAGRTRRRHEPHMLSFGSGSPSEGDISASAPVTP